MALADPDRRRRRRRRPRWASRGSTATTSTGSRAGRPRAAGSVLVRAAADGSTDRPDAGAVQRPDAASTSTAAGRTSSPAGVVVFSDFADGRLYRLDPGADDAGPDHPGRAVALRRPAVRTVARRRFYAVREDHERRRRAGQHDRRHPARRRRADASSSRARTSSPRRACRPDGDAPRLARVGPPGHAVGRDAAARRRVRAGRHARRVDARRRRPGRVDRPARVGARRDAPPHQRPERLVEPVPARRGPAARAARPDRGGVRRSGLDLRPLVVRVPAPTARSSRSAAPSGRDHLFRHRARAPRSARSRRRSPSSTGCRSAPHAIVALAGAPDDPTRRRPARPGRRWPRPASCAGRARSRSTRRRSRCPSRSSSRRPADRTAHALYYPPTQPGVRRAGRGAAAARRAVPRRPDLERVDRARPRQAAPDQPRDRRRRRRLRREHRLRPRVPAPARRAVGRRRRRRLRRGGPLPGRARRRRSASGSPSRAAAPAATRPSPRSPSATSSRPGSAYSGSATSSCSRPTPTSSSRATSHRLVGPYPEAADALPRALADPFRRRDLVPGPRPPGARRPGRAAGPGRGDRRGARREGHPARLPRVRGRGPRVPRRDGHPADARGASCRSSARSSGSSRPTTSSRWSCPGSTTWRRTGGPAATRPPARSRSAV